MAKDSEGDREALEPPRLRPPGPEVLYLRHNIRQGARGGLRNADYLFRACPNARKRQIDVPKGVIPYLSFAIRFVTRGPSPYGDRPERSPRALLLSSLSDVPVAVVAKWLHRSILLVGPLYHLFPLRRGQVPLSHKPLTRIAHRMAALLLVRYADVIHTEVEYIRDWAREHNARLPVIVGAAGAPREDVLRAGGSPSTAPREVDVLFLAALTRAKGVDQVVEAWRRVERARPKATLVLAGFASPSEERELRSWIERTGLRNVRVLTNISTEEKRRLFASSKVHVLASMAEGVPITFFEALAYGVQVVGYDLPTYSGIRAHMLPIPLMDEAALAEGLIGAIDGFPRRSVREVEAGVEFARGHVFEDVLDQVAGGICRALELRISALPMPGSERTGPPSP